jgi:hypothetical protein
LKEDVLERIVNDYLHALVSDARIRARLANEDAPFVAQVSAPLR